MLANGLNLNSSAAVASISPEWPHPASLRLIRPPGPRGRLTEAARSGRAGERPQAGQPGQWRGRGWVWPQAERTSVGGGQATRRHPVITAEGSNMG